MSRISLGLIVAASAAALAIPCGCSRASTARASRDAAAPGEVGPVEGPSVLGRLGLSLDITAFGKMGGLGSAPPTRRVEPMFDLTVPGEQRGMFSRLFRGQSPAELASQSFVLAGADLYRIDCQSCHGPTGVGAPPQINSLVGPVRGTSVGFLADEMRRRSRPVDMKFLDSLAAGAVGDFRKRLRSGGTKMPAFAHLDSQEVDAVLGYLRRIVGVPDAPAADQVLTMPAARVGEHVVKGTCHVCHDATGPGLRGMMMGAGIPSLASMAEEESLGAVIAKVRDGYPPPSMMMMAGPARMPRLPYLTPQELAAAMVYLRQYPPRP